MILIERLERRIDMSTSSFPKVYSDNLKRDVVPQYIDPEDKSWLNLATDVTKLNLPVFTYTKYGKVIFYKYKRPDVVRKKAFHIISRADQQFIKENIWTKLIKIDPNFKFDFYKAEEFKKWHTDSVIVCEGELKAEAVFKLFPGYFGTTYGTKGQYDQYDWTPLKGKQVFLWPDSDKPTKSFPFGTGVDAFQKFALHLRKKYEIEAKLIPVPSLMTVKEQIKRELKEKYKKDSFDLEDAERLGISGQALELYLYKADYYYEGEKKPYTDIKEAINRYIYLADEKTKFYDRFENDVIDKITLDNLWLRAKGLGDYNSGKASDYIQVEHCAVANATTHYPKDEEFIKFGRKTYLNLYESPVFNDPENTDEKYLFDRTAWLRDHLDHLSSEHKKTVFNLECTVAAALQYPEINRGWAVLIYSTFGQGKGLFFDLLRTLTGWQNGVSPKAAQLYSQFGGYMIKGNNIFIRECSKKGIDDADKEAWLKEIITEDEFEVELKHKDFMTHHCHYNLYMSTNYIAPFKVMPGDRRISYVKCNAQPGQKSREYFEDLVKNTKDPIKQAEVFYYYKNIFKIPKDFDMYHCFDTPWKAELIKQSQTGYSQLLDEIYENRLLPMFKLDLWNETQVYKEIKQFLSDNSGYEYSDLYKMSQKQLGHWFEEKGTEKLKPYAVRLKGWGFKKDMHLHIAPHADKTFWRSKANETAFIANYLKGIETTKSEQQSLEDLFIGGKGGNNDQELTEPY